MTNLIVALDLPVPQSEELYYRLRNLTQYFKLGVSALLQPHGQRLAKTIASNDKLMLDLKLYDTKDTVQRTLQQVNAHLVTVHALCLPQPTLQTKILAVDLLTDATGHKLPPTHIADGIVCSPAHAKLLRPKTDKLLVCPGIRLPTDPHHNHTNPQTPAAAHKAGADYIVIGRPIYTSPDPVATTRQILADLTL